jgi:hypothetical protein
VDLEVWRRLSGSPADRTVAMRERSGDSDRIDFREGGSCCLHLEAILTIYGATARADPWLRCGRCRIMATKPVSHPTLEERHAAGRAARERAPRSDLEGWKPATNRPDPVGLLEAQNETREPDLVPVRHGRMMVSPFTFYRGTAAIMAADLKDLPRAGLVVQLCGDAHLSNFGVFASPERTLVFDLKDFDETLPGPFEYDVARLAASFVIAARNNGFSASDGRDAGTASIAGYRQAMRGFADMARSMCGTHASMPKRSSRRRPLARARASGRSSLERRRRCRRPERRTACRPFRN